MVNSDQEASVAAPASHIYAPAELSALAHLYRGELFRSKAWRARLDATTNWAVGTTGLAVSVAFSSADNSALPLLLVSLLTFVFWGIEARRYRYFDIWRTRTRLMEVYFYAPLLRGQPVSTDSGWNRLLAEDYEDLGFHIGFAEALGRRLRRNYIWIHLVIGFAYFGKLIIHPVPIRGWHDLVAHAAVGHFSGQTVLLVVALAYASLLLFALATLRQQQAAGRITDLDDHNEPIKKFGLTI